MGGGGRRLSCRHSIWLVCVGLALPGAMRQVSQIAVGVQRERTPEARTSAPTWLFRSHVALAAQGSEGLGRFSGFEKMGLGGSPEHQSQRETPHSYSGTLILFSAS